MNKMLLTLAFAALITACNNTDEPHGASANTPTINAPETKDIPANASMPKDTLAKMPPSPENTDPNGNYSVKTLLKDDGSWGYQIFLNENMMINQHHIPGVSGLRGFINEEKARRAGDFVIWKIKNRGGQPRVTVQELDSLGVLH